MTHPEDTDLIREALLYRLQAGSLTPECFDEETVAGFAAGTLDAGARTAALGHLAACAVCRSAVASVARALADRAVAREVAGVERTATPRWRRAAVPLTAAAVLLLLAWPPRVSDDGRQLAHRAPTITAGSEPVPVSPIGVISRVEGLQWGSVAGADRFRVTLFAAGGAVLFETQLADTAVSLPDSIVLVPGRPYLWKVEARSGFDRWATSPLVEFTVSGGPRR